MTLKNIYIIFCIFYMLVFSKDLIFKFFGKIKCVQLEDLQEYEVNNGIVKFRIAGTLIDESKDKITLYSAFSDSELAEIKKSNSFKIQTIEALNWIVIHKENENFKDNMRDFIIYNLIFLLIYIIKKLYL